MGSVRVALVAAAVAGLAAAGCGGSGYQYVENEELGVFARVPDDWAMYDTEALLTMREPLSDRALERAESAQWFRGFDASATPSVEQAVGLGRSEPGGFVHVRALSPEERDAVNVSGMRGLLLGVDPMSPTAGQAALGAPPPPEVEVLADEPAEFEGGYHGTHNVFAVAEQGGGVTIVDQTVLLNAASTQMYVFAVGCDEECYFETSSDEIEAIVDSWTIDESSQS